jgi:hypothetical protein
MERGRIESLKRRLQGSNSLDFQKVADELLRDLEQVPTELLAVFKSRLAVGAMVSADVLAQFVIRTRDRTLYEIPQVKSALLSNIMILPRLLEARIPDEEIEKRVCADLEMRMKSEDAIFRRICVEALRDFGSLECLGTLEAVEYDFHGKYKAADVIQSASDATGTADRVTSLLEYSQSLMRSVDIAFGRLLKEAISEVRVRAATPLRDWGEEMVADSDPFAASRRYLHLARGSLDSDLGAALNNARKALESLLKATIAIRKLKPRKDGPIDQMELPELIGTVMSDLDNKPPKAIHVHMETVQRLSTIGSHDQGMPIEIVSTKESVTGVLSQVEILIRYFAQSI